MTDLTGGPRWHRGPNPEHDPHVATPNNTSAGRTALARSRPRNGHPRPRVFAVSVRFGLPAAASGQGALAVAAGVYAPMALPGFGALCAAAGVHAIEGIAGQGALRAAAFTKPRAKGSGTIFWRAPTRSGRYRGRTSRAACLRQTP